MVKRKRTAKRAATVVMLAAATGAAFVITLWAIEAFLDADGSAAEVVSARFPADWPVAATSLLHAEMFAAHVRKRQAAAQPAPPASRVPSSEQFLTALKAVQARMPPPPPPPPPNAFFNETQIASIKERLKLTPEQERYWPPMEAALRQLAWRPRERGDSNGATLDPDSVQRLKEVADNLLLQLSEEQKRQVRLLANVVGLKVDF